MANKKERGLEYKPSPSLVRLAQKHPSVLSASQARFIGHLVPDEATLEE